MPGLFGRAFLPTLGGRSLYIESAQNARVKTWANLKSKKGRQTSGTFLVEGERLVMEALQSHFSIEAVLWDVGTDELSDVVQHACEARGIKVIELSPAAFNAVSDTVTPQGIAAVVGMPSPVGMGKFDGNQTALVVDGVQDPGNLGTLLRSADAFGVGVLCCGTGSVDPYAPKVVRASMGGIFRLNVVVQSSARFIEAWKQKHPDGQVVTTRAQAHTPCFQVDFCQPTLLLIGSEAAGVSEEAGNLADLEIAIPMEVGAESLNAGMAGSILLYEAYRQRQTLGEVTVSHDS